MCRVPYGYRYVGRHEADDVARVEVVEDEARIVRQVFGWVGVERVSLREAGRRLQEMGCPTRTGLGHWDATTIAGMPRNPAYTGTAMFGRTRVATPSGERLRPIRGRPHPARRASGSRVRVPPEEWIPIPVPAIIGSEVFEAAGAQLDENRRRKRDGRRRPGWLLQGLVVCRCCGHAFYGRMARGMVGGRQPADYGYYRCTGTDAHKFGGHAPCDNRAVRSGKLEEAVWREVVAALDDPGRVAAEHQRRAVAARDGDPHRDLDALDAQIARLQRGIDRLIDGYAEELISADEFRPRLAGLKGRLSRLRAERDAAAAAHETERSLQLVISRLEEFSERVHAGLEALDWPGRREIIRALVRRIEIDRDGVAVVFRIPGTSPPGASGPGPSSLGENAPSGGDWQHRRDSGRPARRGHPAGAVRRLGNAARPLHDAGTHRRRQRHTGCQPVRRASPTRRPSPPRSYTTRWDTTPHRCGNQISNGGADWVGSRPREASSRHECGQRSWNRNARRSAVSFSPRPKRITRRAGTVGTARTAAMSSPALRTSAATRRAVRWAGGEPARWWTTTPVARDACPAPAAGPDAGSLPPGPGGPCPSKPGRLDTPSPARSGSGSGPLPVSAILAGSAQKAMAAAGLGTVASRRLGGPSVSADGAPESVGGLGASAGVASCRGVPRPSPSLPAGACGSAALARVPPADDGRAASTPVAEADGGGGTSGRTTEMAVRGASPAGYGADAPSGSASLGMPPGPAGLGTPGGRPMRSATLTMLNPSGAARWRKTMPPPPNISNRSAETPRGTRRPRSRSVEAAVMPSPRAWVTTAGRPWSQTQGCSTVVCGASTENARHTAVAQATPPESARAGSDPRA